MKILVLTVTAGQGHNQTANALIKYMEFKNIKCNVIDTFDYINPVLKESISSGYLFSTKFAPKIYGKVYSIAEKRERELNFSKVTNWLFSKSILKYIEEFAPDFIICTHIFAAQIISYLQSNNKISCKTAGIITDFTVHPFWEQTCLSYYVTANELLNLQLVKKGISVSKILPFGIPINDKFSRKIAKKEARHMLGINDMSTILVMSGSMGFGNVINIIKSLDKIKTKFQILSVCGSNRSLKLKIDRLDLKKPIYNFGFSDDIDIMMDASNCIITKPGGLTVSESLAKELPMFLINPIPGQEDRNAEFLLNNGLASLITETYPIDEALYALFKSKRRSSYLKDVYKKIGKPNATKTLIDFILYGG